MHDYLISESRVTCCSSPIASGKTTGMIERAAELVDGGEKVLIVAPTKVLVDQIARDLDIDILEVVNARAAHHDAVRGVRNSVRRVRRHRVKGRDSPRSPRAHVLRAFREGYRISLL